MTTHGRTPDVPLICLDYNCFQRGFDDPRQVRVQLEALACQRIFEMAEDRRIHLAWSFMHEDETILCPFPERRLEVMRLAAMCRARIGPMKEVERLAESFRHKASLSAKDAIHLACASHINADFFITCDTRLVRQSEALGLDLRVINPID